MTFALLDTLQGCLSTRHLINLSRDELTVCWPCDKLTTRFW